MILLLVVNSIHLLMKLTRGVEEEGRNFDSEL